MSTPHPLAAPLVIRSSGASSSAVRPCVGGPGRRRDRLAWALAVVLAGGWLPAGGASAQGPAAGPAPASAGAVLYEGQRFDRSLSLLGTELRLNGTGVRQVAWFKGYLVALYLGVSASTSEQVQAAPGPKRLHLRMLQEVPAVEFSKAVRKGMTRNASPAEQAALAGRLDRFVALIDRLGKVKPRDVVDLDFDPARGLLMRVNGQPHGEPIAGADFYAVLLRSFVGARPYDEKMRDGLLGRPQS